MASFRNTYLKDICNFEKGSEGLAKAMPGEYLLVTTGAERRTCESFQFDTKAVCIPLVSSTGHGHASLKNVHYQEGKFALGTILVALTAIDDNELDIQFLHLYLSQLKDIILVPLMSGAANVALSVTKIKNIEIPLPPIEQQKEIVVQFKSIVIEEAELKNELTHQQTLLKKLRQQILQEAIEGKLTKEFRIRNDELRTQYGQELAQATDPETIRNLKLKIRNCSESAASLLQRIKAEKEQLIKDKKIKKHLPAGKAGKALPPITDEEKPFDLPDGWVWCRLGSLCDYAQGVQVDLHKQRKSNGKNLVRFLRIVDFTQETDDQRFIESPGSKYHIGKDELVMVRYGASSGFVGTGKKGVLANNLFKIKYGKLNKSFLSHFFISPYFLRVLAFNARGVAMPAISFKFLDALVFPLPPLPEQKTIVAKVETLFAICDQLEAQITQNQIHAEQLMQAVLKEAFENSNDREVLYE